MRAMHPAKRLAWLVGALLVGCTVGPNFRRPEAPHAGYGKVPAAVGAGGVTPQRFIAGEDIPGQWWTVFHSRALDQLVAQALKHNPTLASAEDALRQADELVAVERGTFFPQVQAGYDVSRQRNAIRTLQPTLTSGQPLFSLHTAQVSVSYLLDVFGGNRRQLEALEAQADYQRDQVDAAYITLSANVVAAAIQEASLRAQLAATQDIVRSEREAARILRRQYELGSIAEIEVMAQEAALAASEATVPGLMKQLEQQRHRLAALAGRFPSDAPPPRFELDDLTLPREIPVSLPAMLVRHRPDVLAAEAQLHAATAEVGVAIASMLPQINLTASEGGASTVFSQLLASGNTFWSAGADLSQTLFAGGALLHGKRAAEAAMDEAAAQYRSVVLAAFQNVADCLTALRLDAAAESASQRAAQAAATSLTATRRNVELGLASYLALLNAQQTYQQAALNLAQARANRYADTVALFESLGGGWWNRRA